MTIYDKAIWGLVLALGLALLALAAHGDGPTQGSGAAALIKKAEASSPKQVWTTNVMAWKYADPNYTNVWFNLQTSTDLRNWQTIRSNVTGNIVVTNQGERCRVYRLVGRFHP